MYGETMVNCCRQCAKRKFKWARNEILYNEKSKQKQKSIYFKHICFLAANKQLYEHFSLSISGVITIDKGDVHAKGQVRGQKSRSLRSKPNLAVSGP